MPWESKFQQFRRRTSEDHLALGAGEVDLLEKLDGALIAHVEAEVAADHDALGAHFLDHELHDLLGMDDGVVEESVQIRARSLGKLLDLRAHLPAVVDAADQDEQSPAAMGPAEAEVGMAVEHAAEDEVARGDGRVDGIAQEIGEIEFPQAIAADGLQRMQEDGQVELLYARPDRFE